MDPQKAKSIFLHAVEHIAPDEWPNYLSVACSDNLNLRHEVEGLLAAHQDDGDLADQARQACADALPTSDQPITEKPGTQIGPYKLLEQIGEGGMGVVYMAEQKEPVRRRVALKIIKPGMDTRQVIARFEAERQALAMMDHPNIAKVLDAGATESGRPYFVMELVNGVSITQYCDEQHLTPKERLELFVPVCQAVQHAHQKGIIHRDLKPSNILVAMYDNKAVPKIIDFGVAKATSQTLTEKTVFTQLGQVVGTLEYMSPEQAERNQLDIDTRSDIYSLGVVLYELLTGETPFDRERLRSAAFDEMLRIIREEEPSKPSIKVSSSQSLPSIAANRRIEPAKLGSMIRGELDWLVMKALEKDRCRRYQTAIALEADIENYLSHRPVLACPPTAGYRLRKAAWKHRVLLSTMALISFSLLIGIVSTVVQAGRAHRAERVAIQRQVAAEGRLDLAREAVNEYLSQVAHDPRLKSADLSDLRKQLLEAAIPFYERLAQEQPDSDAQTAAVGDAYLQLGRIHDELAEYRLAQQDYRRMKEIYTELSNTHPDEDAYREGLAGSLENHAFVSRKLGQLEAAQRSLQQAIVYWKQLADANPDVSQYAWHLARALNNQGNLSKQLGRPESARISFDQSLRLLTARIGEGEVAEVQKEQFAATSHDFGLLCHQEGQLREALELFEQSRETYQSLSDAAPPSSGYRSGLASVLRSQSNALRDQGDIESALSASRQALAIHQSLSDRFPSLPGYRRLLADTHNNLGALLRQQEGELSQEISHYQAALSGYEFLLDATAPTAGLLQAMAHTHQNIGNALVKQQRLEEGCQHLLTAAGLLQRLVDEYESTPEYQFDRASVLKALGWTMRLRKMPTRAGEYLRDSVDILTPLVDEQPSNVRFRELLADAWNDLGVVRSEQDDTQASQQAYEQALGQYEHLLELTPDSMALRVGIGGLQCNLGNLETKARRWNAALERFDRAATLLNEVLETNREHQVARRNLRNTCWSRAEVYEQLGEFDDAAVDWKQAIELTPESERLAYRRSLAFCLARTSQHEQATLAATSLLEDPGANTIENINAACVFAAASFLVKSDDEVLHEQYARRAVELLEMARDAKFFRTRADVERLANHPQLASLRQREDFKKLLRDLNNRLEPTATIRDRTRDDPRPDQ